MKDNFYIVVKDGIHQATLYNRELKAISKRLSSDGILHSTSPQTIEINDSYYETVTVRGITFRNEADMNFFLLINQGWIRWTRDKFLKFKEGERNEFNY